MTQLNVAAAFGAALALLAAPLMSHGQAASPSELRPDQVKFRALYKELVETNTSLSVGDCTLAAKRMAAHLTAAGYPDSDIVIFTAPGHPKEGGLVARLPGKDPKQKAVLLLAHLDVVEAKREDWARDPFTLIEENGYFYARGASDDKSMASIWVDTLVRLKEEHYQPKRTIKMALTCGEETSGAFNGAEYLATQKHDLIDAAFAINEGGGGQLGPDGKPVFMGIQVGEKLSQNYNLDVTNPGGHSSRPVPDNAIYHLAGGLLRLSQYHFPVTFSDTTRAFFTKLAAIRGGEEGAAMLALVKDPTDAKATALLEKNPNYNAVLHTNCVATLLQAGHATNALPQHAQANVNCRIFPGESVEAVRQKLETIVADPQIKVSIRDVRSAASPPPPLDKAVLEPAEKLATKMWPDVPNLLIMSSGATDGAFLTPNGIPTYGISGKFGDADGNGVHGLNERIRVKSLYDSRDYLFTLVKIYAPAK